MTGAETIARHREASGKVKGLAERDRRQRVVAEWCAAAFGVGQSSSVPQRALRLLEEAVEAYQAAGCSLEQAHRLVDFVFDRPAGDLKAEIGQVGITLLALAAADGASADEEEAGELARVLAKPIEHYRARNRAKNDAGFLAGPPAAAPRPRAAESTSGR